jgi:hypothetical protein
MSLNDGSERTGSGTLVILGRSLVEGEMPQRRGDTERTLSKKESSDTKRERAERGIKKLGKERRKRGGQRK